MSLLLNPRSLALVLVFASCARAGIEADALNECASAHQILACYSELQTHGKPVEGLSFWLKETQDYSKEVVIAVSTADKTVLELRFDVIHPSGALLTKKVVVIRHLSARRIIAVKIPLKKEPLLDLQEDDPVFGRAPKNFPRIKVTSIKMK